MEALNSYPICSLIASRTFWLVSIRKPFVDLCLSYAAAALRQRRIDVFRKSKSPAELTQRGFCSGDVLLSHNLSSHYHRGCSVSLPCSEWERVVPLRYYHQNLAPLTALNSGHCRFQIVDCLAANLQSEICILQFH